MATRKCIRFHSTLVVNRYGRIKPQSLTYSCMEINQLAKFFITKSRAGFVFVSKTTSDLFNNLGFYIWVCCDKPDKPTEACTDGIPPSSKEINCSVSQKFVINLSLFPLLHHNVC
ncbi:hypothetical protein L6164_028920 [Bauhinia variegata]|uniref:Uncharacterized protein n=1 Tax=Bauhinia variegata TaxID=167791 RepID=A0ACB9L7L4_BAUVA|nr:hypothetical protein L6164_028920 [Bauhinia variegata]